MNYKKIIEEIRNLPWEEYDPHSIVFISLISAIEFANSLRCAIRAYPENKNLAEMASGELQTNNLIYGDYNTIGDHSDFLKHFIYGNSEMLKKGGAILNQNLRNAGYSYNENVAKLGDDKIKAMTIFSREQELPNIFKKIMEAHAWEKLGLGFYKYYLKRHIELDGDEGGHANLTKDFELDEDVLEKFYKIRLTLYGSLET